MDFSDTELSELADRNVSDMLDNPADASQLQCLKTRQAVVAPSNSVPQAVNDLRLETLCSVEGIRPGPDCPRT